MTALCRHLSQPLHQNSLTFPVRPGAEFQRTVIDRSERIKARRPVVMLGVQPKILWRWIKGTYPIKTILWSCKTGRPMNKERSHNCALNLCYLRAANSSSIARSTLSKASSQVSPGIRGARKPFTCVYWRCSWRRGKRALRITWWRAAFS